MLKHGWLRNNSELPPAGEEDLLHYHGQRAVRLGYKDIPGSPVLFPAFCREALLAYEGDRGGMEVIRQKQIPCDTVQAKDEWELWDVDTPEKMERVREVRSRLTKEE